ncbi:hypothetical protein [Sandarakinorhabdus limnophila]|uniref:hypothetical protein n=1 Tax=Sandarakinorhabdus limnophila TaxID=210512 RepID=UPI0026F0F70F|nr:hypothetical protein [Sandarakinorhabdus limnophila]
MMAEGIIWGTALLAYGTFRLWYDNWSGPLKPTEIDAFLAQMAGRFEATGNSPDVLRAFLAADDGREFVMLNLVKAQLDPVEDPQTGQMVQGFELLKRYSKRFMPVLFRNGGHPGIVGRKVGGYVDAWNTEPDPGWTVFGLMRYRSRRDMIKLVMDPAFMAGHPDKLLGTLATFSFPTQRVLSFYVGPRVTVALVLALIAALSHLMMLTIAS